MAEVRATEGQGGGAKLGAVRGGGVTIDGEAREE